MIKVNCEAYAQEILDNVKAIPNKRKLTIITVGDNPASESYVKGKVKDCEYCGISYEHIKIPFDGDLNKANVSLDNAITKANHDNSVCGIIVQLPLPKGMDEDFFTDMVKSSKDVDGFKSDSPFNPCTPEGIVYVMKKEFGETLNGIDVLLIGKGKLVGKPLINMLLDEGCTLTICHSKTSYLNSYIEEYHDCIITAVGIPNLVDCRHIDSSVKLVIDAGVNRVDGKLCGDVCNYDGGYEFQCYTPVPKGIGLMTRAMLMKHVGDASKNGGIN